MPQGLSRYSAVKNVTLRFISESAKLFPHIFTFFRNIMLAQPLISIRLTVTTQHPQQHELLLEFVAIKVDNNEQKGSLMPIEA